MAALTLAPNPTACLVTSAKYAKQLLGAKHVTREPRDGELLVIVDRPQVGPYEFRDFAKNEFFTFRAVHPDSSLLNPLPCIVSHYVVVAAKPGCVSTGEGYKKWRQVLVVRVASDADHAAVAQQAAADEAQGSAILQGMMDR